MWIRAQIVGCENRELETKRGVQHLTELYILDADNKKNLYVGQIWGEKFYSYPENEVVTFQIAGVSERGKKVYLSLLPEDNKGL
ncbi:MAG: hypothetical protein NUW09_00885 [Deltaproteobacteria bacterium]|nr:hypothetical protein [Deltaproteobacteria bacterium]